MHVAEQSPVALPALSEEPNQSRERNPDLKAQPSNVEEPLPQNSDPPEPNTSSDSLPFNPAPLSWNVDRLNRNLTQNNKPKASPPGKHGGNERWATRLWECYGAFLHAESKRAGPQTWPKQTQELSQP